MPLIVAIPLAGQLSVFQLTNTVTADGTITGTEWDDATAASSIFLNHLSSVTGGGLTAPTNAADLSGNVRLKWDTSNLYALFEINDDTRGEDSADGNGIANNLNSFDDDSVEINFGTSTSVTGNLDGVDKFQYRLNPNSLGNDEIEATPLTTSGAGIVWGFANTGTASNYVVEAAIPWSTLNVTTPTIGNEFSFMAGVNDDDGSDREHQLFWNSTSSTAWNDATQWSDIQLAAAIPEPSTYAMIFGLVGLASVIIVKRRKAAAAE